MSFGGKFPGRVMQSKMSGFKPDLISNFPGVEVVGSSGSHEFLGRVMGCKSLFSGFVKFGQSFLKGGECYGTRSWSYLFCCTFNSFDYWFSFYVHHSYRLLCWHISIHCVVVNFPSPCFSQTDAYLLSRWHVNLFPLSHPYSMTFQHVPPLGPCAYLGHINPAPICTTVTVRGHGLIFSVVHLPPLTDDSPFTFTVLVIFFTDTFRYIVW